MKHTPVPIGIAEDSRGLVVSLPPRFWLMISLGKAFPRMLPEPQAWTYRLPANSGAPKRLEAWIAEVELQLRADARRRAWTATEDEWNDAPSRPARAIAQPEAVIVTLPGERTGPAVLDLLRALAGGAVLTAAIDEDGARRYRLAPSGRSVRSVVAERAIRERLIAPGLEDLFDPDWSQTWRLPASPEVLAALPEPKNPKPRPKAEPKPSRTRSAPRSRAEELHL